MSQGSYAPERRTSFYIARTPDFNHNPVYFVSYVRPKATWFPRLSHAIYEMVFSTMEIPYFSFSSFMMGSLILGLMGARMPLSEICPLSTCFTATPQGTPTVLAMAE